MSIYAVNKLGRRVVHEPDLRQALNENPEATLRALTPPLDDDEIASLLRGDVGWLGRHGANHFLLQQLARFELFGLTLPSYGDRIRAEYRAERAGREWV